MTISPGTRLGPYEIQAPLGAGGMGEVYRAKDTRLDRMVAIKALPEQLAADEDRMARLQREAKLLAALHHPHIAAIHGLEESNGSLFLILELAEGETLSKELARRRFSLEDALAAALQIAEALEAAHEKGIVHRDLKPANVKIDASGQIKLLDFGLAKVWTDTPETMSRDLSQSPTAAHMATADGMILGTAAYMSPEQARGKPVDRRTDIWAFGVLLFEMLTGKELFQGETVSDILAGILKSDLNLDALPPETPDTIKALLKRCLERDPRRRLQDIGEARIVIEDYLANPQKVLKAAAPAQKKIPIIPWALAGLFLLLFAGTAIWPLLHRPTAAPAKEVTAFAVSLSPGESMNPDEAPIIALSPDGKTLAFSGTKDKSRHLFIRRMDQIEPIAVTGADNAINPFFSPDGRWIGFFADGKLQKISISGGAPIVLADAVDPRGACWTPDDRIVFSPSFDSGLMIIPASGGTPQSLTVPDASKNERTHRWPEPLPNGKAVLFSIGWIDSPSNYDNGDIAVVSLDTKQRKTLIHNSRMARYMSPGYILFQRSTTLFAAAFDQKTLTLTLPEMLVQEGVGGETSCGAGYFATDQNGTLAAVPTSAVTNDSKLVILDRTGKGTALPLPVRSYNTPRFSPDGKQLVFGVGDASGANSDIWTYDFASGGLNRLTFTTHNAAPIWSADGKKIVYTSASGNNEGLNWKSADGSGEEQHLITNPTGPSGAGAWSADGNLLLYTVTGHADDIALLDIRNPLKSKPFLATNNVECCPSVSPDGRWVSYVSSETGTLQVFVTSFPDATGKWQVSNERGYNPMWTRKGNEILYVSGNRIMAAPVETTPTFRAGAPQLLFESASFFGTPPRNSADVSPDGQKIVVVQSSENLFVPKQINLFQHFSTIISRLHSAR